MINRLALLNVEVVQMPDRVGSQAHDSRERAVNYDFRQDAA